MGSGIYSALSGAVAKMQQLEVTVNNLANIGDIGFKADRVSFESVFNENLQNHIGRGVNFTRTSGSFTDFSQGDLETTNRSLDVAIKGEGFFKVAAEDGFLYTRQGNFKLDKQNNLVTSINDLQVIGEDGPVNFPHSNVLINKEGMVTADGNEIGRLTVYEIPENQNLLRKGNGFWELKPGAADKLSTGASLLQGSLERANVNAILLTTEIIETKRAYAAFMNTMKIFSDISEKAREIGRLG